jgi:hypothetical protein
MRAAGILLITVLLIGSLAAGCSPRGKVATAEPTFPSGSATTESTEPTVTTLTVNPVLPTLPPLHMRARVNGRTGNSLAIHVTTSAPAAVCIGWGTNGKPSQHRFCRPGLLTNGDVVLPLGDRVRRVVLVVTVRSPDGQVADSPQLSG